MSGIYSATYLEASPLGSAFFRLIVRGEGLGAGVVAGVRGWEPCGYFLWVPGLPHPSAAVLRWARVTC